MTEYWDREIETMPQDRIKELQLKLFNQQLERARKAPAYQGKLPLKIDSLDEVKNLPFTCKDDLRQNFPYGFLAVPKEEIVRYISSSGTTGIPTLIAFSRSDLTWISNRSARHFFTAGLRKGELVQCMMGFGLFGGGWYHMAGAMEIGGALPTGSGNTQRQIFFLKTLKIKYCYVTPSYLQYLLSKLSLDERQEVHLKVALVGGEKLSKSLRKILNERYNIELYDCYGLSETGGPIAADCPYHDGLHIAEDQFYCEIINPETGNLVPDGEYGELVVTPLQQEAMPLIRYRTRDITRFLPGDCPCGRTHRRIEPITHRIDDMMIINGVNVFPSQIEECIYKHLTTATNYLIHIKEKDGLKKLVIDIELPNEQLQNSEGMKKLEYELIQTLKAYITVTPRLNFIPIGTLPEIQGKAKRVVKDVE